MIFVRKLYSLIVEIEVFIFSLINFYFCLSFLYYIFYFLVVFSKFSYFFYRVDAVLNRYTLSLFVYVGFKCLRICRSFINFFLVDMRFDIKVLRKKRKGIGRI